MKLKIYQRNIDKKSEKNQIRQRGDIPAVLYCNGKENQNIAVSGSDFNKALRSISQGHLPTTVFELEGEGFKSSVIVKDIHYAVTTYDVLHLDLLVLDEKQKVKVNVPVQFTGVAECNGIKLGGFLRQIIRHVQVECFPKDLPSHFTLDVEKLGIKQSKRVKDIEVPKDVKSLAPLNEVVVVIAKR